MEGTGEREKKERVPKTLLVPDPTDKETVLNLADMSFNAYEDRNSSSAWKPVPGFNKVPFSFRSRKRNSGRGGREEIAEQ